MSFTQDLFTSRRNFSDGSTRVGQQGRIWYDYATRSFRIGDSVTAGGTIYGGIVLGSNDNSTRILNDLELSANLVIDGNLTVNGLTTTINTITVTVDDKNIELASTQNPTDALADGGGISLNGTTTKTLNWSLSTTSWTSSENLDLVTTKSYRIANQLIANSTTLGSGIVNSSLERVAVINTGTWQGTIVDPTYGGTGTNNGAKTITLGGNLATVGNFNLSLILSATSNITLPSSGTVATLAGIETLTNKTVNLGNNIVSGTRAQFDAACSDDNFGFTGSKLSQFAATSSSELAGVISDETGTGALVFANTPTLVTPTLGAASATSVSISSVITLAPLSAAPASPTTGMIAVADYTNWDPAPSGSGTHAYPVFYAAGIWHRMI